MRRVTIYTDGSCSPNPGPGGWAALIQMETQPDRVYSKMLQGGTQETTNNRMELMAAIAGLRQLSESLRVDLYSDSEYVVKGMTEWIEGWIERDWKRVKNRDLWEQLVELASKHEVQWRWVKGHSDDEWNDLVDCVANEERVKQERRVDGSTPG